MATSEEIQTMYAQRAHLFQRLKDEAVFSLNSALNSENIKIHSLEARVKTLDSLIQKVQRKGYSKPFDQSPDLVGLRVVCLFLSDLAKVRSALNAVFEILQEENKVDGAEPDVFGYMSIHYVCKIGERASGPRYDFIENIQFEVQVRTIVMDAWANVSHHLAYKGDAAIPKELRRDFNALSGLFYVADQHFELFAQQDGKSQKTAEAEIAGGNLDDVALNSNTLQAFIRQRYLDRAGSDKESISDLAAQLLRGGYSDMRKLESALDLGDPAVLGKGVYEHLNDVGVVRRAICEVDPNYNKIVEEDWKEEFLLKLLEDPEESDSE